MATSDTEQKSILVRQHARLAMGEKITGTSLQPKGGSQQKPAGGLSHVVNKKNK